MKVGSATLGGLMLTVGMLLSSYSLAATVTFEYSGKDSANNTATGSFTIDDGLFNGANPQFILNSNMLSLSFTVNTGSGPLVFGTADIDASSSTEFNSSVSPPTIVDGFGLLATHLSNSIAIEGVNGIDLFTSLPTDSYSGTWTEVTTPLPATLPLFATGLGAIGLLGWRRKKKAAA